MGRDRDEHPMDAAVGMAVVLASANGSGTALDRTYTVKLRERAVHLARAARAGRQRHRGAAGRAGRACESTGTRASCRRGPDQRGQSLDAHAGAAGSGLTRIVRGSRSLRSVAHALRWGHRSGGAGRHCALEEGGRRTADPSDTERAVAVAAMRQGTGPGPRRADGDASVDHAARLRLVHEELHHDKAADRPHGIEGVHGLTLNSAATSSPGAAPAKRSPWPTRAMTPRTARRSRHPRARPHRGNERRLSARRRHRRPHYSHILDPRTAVPAGNVISATVVADTPTDAGALATAFTVLTPAESRALAASGRNTSICWSPPVETA